MISYLGSLVQFSPAAGRAGCCGQMLLCMGSICRVLARQPEVLAASPRVRRAFSLRGERPGQPEVCAASPRACRAFSLCGLRKSLDRNRGPVCSVGGGGFSGAEFAPFPSPCLLPPAGTGRLSSGVSQPPCFANRRRCVPPVNFSFLSHSLKKPSSDCSQGLSAGPPGRSSP